MTADALPEARQRAAELAKQPLVEVTSARGIGTIAEIRRVLNYREMLDLLIRRELKVRYKDSALGFAWTLIRPLVMLLVYYVAVGKFLGGDRTPGFAIYLFTGLTLWQLVSEVLSTCTGSILANQGLVKKVDLPLEVFPLAAVGAALFNFGVQLLVLLVAAAALADFPFGVRLLYAPLAVAVALVWATGIGFILGALNVYLRDTQYLVEVGLFMGFWTCPIAYTWKLMSDATLGHPVIQQIYLLNPFAVAVQGFQRAIWVAGDGEPSPANLGLRLVIMLVAGLLMLLIGQKIFQRMSGNFAQEL